MGFQHLLDFNGYDHMLFLWMSFLGFTIWNYKRAFFQVSIFTLAHSITLALCVFQWIPLTTAWVERMIALSIAIQALIPLLYHKNKHVNSIISGILIFSFGLIHGMGFSGLLISLLGHSESTAIPLLFFNVGLEIGQLFFVLILLVLQSAIQKYIQKFTAYYIRVSAIIGFLLGLSLFLSRF